MPPLVGSVENQSLAKRMRPGLGIPILKICVHFGAQVLPTESVCVYYFISYQTIIWCVVYIYVSMYLCIYTYVISLGVYKFLAHASSQHPLQGHHGVKWASPVFRTRCCLISVAAGKVLEHRTSFCRNDDSDQWEFVLYFIMDQNFWGYSLKFRPNIYGGYLQFRILKFPLK